MTDAAYCLRETERERKSLARMSRYKKNGSRTSYVRLPQTYMTEKEIRKMHGKIETMSLCNKYSKDEFLKFNDDLKKLYIQHLIDQYNPRRKDIAEMLGLSYGGFVRMCRDLFPVNPFKNEGKGAKPTQDWLDFITYGKVVSKPPVVEEPPKPVEVEAAPKAPQELPKLTLESVRVRYIGKIGDAFSEVFKLVGNDKDFVINIELYPPVPTTETLPF